MSAVRFPAGYRIEALRRDHPRSAICSGQVSVDDWLATNALQNEGKHLLDCFDDRAQTFYQRWT